jgi:hypothetical protein
MSVSAQRLAEKPDYTNETTGLRAAEHENLIADCFAIDPRLGIIHDHITSLFIDQFLRPRASTRLRQHQRLGYALAISYNLFLH